MARTWRVCWVPHWLILITLPESAALLQPPHGTHRGTWNLKELFHVHIYILLISACRFNRMAAREKQIEGDGLGTATVVWCCGWLALPILQFVLLLFCASCCFKSTASEKQEHMKCYRPQDIVQQRKETLDI